MRIPRKLKKQRKGNIIIMDICSFPKNFGWDINIWLEFLHTEGVAVWDSSLGGQAPKILNRKARIQIKDLNKK